ncbi:hypothetical protein AB0F68_24080 [Micromonospora sp. NPDC023966]|uniref:hypothetical protein n=1 Tax=Micromonospora sp. NPDC023966 TaxID=3154699 RepID=UPI00340608B2
MEIWTIHYGVDCYHTWRPIGRAPSSSEAQPTPTRPQGERAPRTCADFQRSQAHALPACDFLETVTPFVARMYGFAVIEHANRRIRILGATAHPTASWMAQAAKNLIMDLEDGGCRARFLIRDRDGKFTELFDAVLKDAGTEVVSAA